jgi:hypothetical protein
MSALAKELHTARQWLDAVGERIETDAAVTDDRKAAAVSLFAEAFDAVWKIGKELVYRDLGTNSLRVEDAIRELFLSGCFSEEQNRAARHMLEARKQIRMDRHPDTIEQIYPQLPMYRIQLQQWLNRMETHLLKKLA